ncbi:hypothetical protein MASR2M47_24820 [Draconibacterium sp.]
MKDVTLIPNCVILIIARNLIFVKYELVTNLKFIVMPILTIIIVILVVGVILWLINSYVPMQSTIKGILNAVVVIILVIWLLKVFGVLSSLQNLTV